MTQFRFFARMADIVLLERPSRQWSLFHPANLGIALIWLIGGLLGYWTNQYWVAGAGLAIIPIPLLWLLRAIAIRLRRLGILQDLEPTPHGLDMIHQHLETVASQYATRALLAHASVYIVVMWFNFLKDSDWLVLAGILGIGAPLYHWCAQTGKDVGLRHPLAHEQISQFTEVLTSLLSTLVLIALLAIGFGAFFGVTRLFLAGRF